MEREREGEKHQCVVASCIPPTEGLAHNPGMCPDWELNRRPFGSQASTQSTEPHQSGLEIPSRCTVRVGIHILSSFLKLGVGRMRKNGILTNLISHLILPVFPSEVR